MSDGKDILDNDSLPRRDQEKPRGEPIDISPKGKSSGFDEQDDITSKQPVEERRAREQAFLIANYDKLESENIEKEYDHFHKLRGDPAEAMSKITTAKYDDALLTIRHADMAKLVPHLRIFKVFYDEEGNEDDVLELPFDEHTTHEGVSYVEKVGQGGKKDLNESDINDLTKPKAGRGAGVGLKSFEWEFMGSNMEQRSNNIDVTMELFFQTIQDLTKKRTVENAEGETNSVSFLDLVAPISQFERKADNQNKTQSDLNPRTFKDTYYRIKVLVGWEGPQNGDLGDAIPDESPITKAELQRAIKNTRTLMTLELKDHELQFNQNGTAELTINFHAATNAAMMEPQANVLAPTEEEAEELLGIKKEIENTEKTIEDKKEIKENTNFDNQGIDTLKEKVKELEGKIERERTDLYKRLLERIFDNGRLFELQKVPSGWLGDFSEEQSFIWGGNEEISSMSTEERKDLFADAGQRGGEFNKQARKEGLKQKREIEDKIEIKPWSDSESLIQTSKEEIDKTTNENAEASSSSAAINKDGTASIKYFYLGDLIDAAMEVFYQRNGDSARYMKFLLGDLHIINPYTGRPDLVNLADIPVSYNVFFEWFLDTIVKPQKENYLMKYFLEGVCKSLVTDVLETGVLGELLDQKAKISMHNFSAPSKKGKDQLLSVPEREALGSEALGTAVAESREFLRRIRSGTEFQNGAESEELGGSGPVDQFQNGGTIRHIDQILASENSIFHSINDVKGAIDYQLIYPTNVSAPYLDATRDNAEEEDMQKGIYWFNIGNDKGLFREMSFSRVDQPYAREARIQGDQVSRFTRLKEHYEVEIRLHGNALFLPGDYIFVNPSVIGFGNPQSVLAQNTGLVGYYQLITVKGVIERGNFETTLNGTLGAYGTGEGEWVRDGAGTKGGPNQKAEKPTQNSAKSKKLKNKVKSSKTNK